MLEFFSSGGAARQPQCTEPCQCVSGQPWACHEVLQGQMQSLQCAGGLVEAELGATAGLGRRFVGVVAVLPLSWSFSVEEAPLGNHSAQSPASV